jgi:hypothetical protein
MANEKAKQIVLSSGRKVIVNSGTYRKLAKFTWHELRTANTSYAFRCVKHRGTVKTILMHREIMGQTKRALWVGHNDHNGLNNLKSNLRVGSRKQCLRSRRKLDKTTSSRYKGVYFEKDREQWKAHIKVNGTKMHIGRFHTQKQAALAYDAAARKHFGEFACTNFPAI